MSVPNTDNKPAPPPVEMIKVKVDGREIAVPKMTPDWQGKLQPTTMLQACNAAGIDVPHYCYHSQLPIAGNCRMCIMEFGTPAMGPDRKPVLNPDGTTKILRSVLPYEPTTPRGAIACATPVSPGMELYPNSPATKQMRESVLESLLINHPLDCPICDQAGECKLQEYVLEYGKTTSRFAETKVHKPKQIEIGPRVMLDNERCVLCTRCVRFTRDVVGDDVLGITHRGGHNTIATFPGTSLENNYSLNTVDLCPVGALTSKDFRFQMRVWFLKEAKSICTSCATGCNIIVGSRENKVLRYEPRENQEVNSCWMCDSGRLNYKWVNQEDRLTRLGGSRIAQGADWDSVVGAIAELLKKAAKGSVAIIASAKQTNEELFLLKKLADHVGAVTDSVPRTGESDKILLNADRNPNSSGAIAIGIAASPMGSNLPKIAEGIRAGTINTLLVFGEDVTQCGIDTALLDKLQTLIVSDILPNQTTARAHFLLPGCAHLEKRGSFTNAKGRVQRFMQAIDTKGASRAEWETLTQLLQQIGAWPRGKEVPDNMESLFNLLAQEIPAFTGLTWAGLGDGGATLKI